MTNPAVEETPAASSATTLPPVQPNPQALIERAVCLVLKRGRLGVSRKAKAKHVEPTAPLTMEMAGGVVLTDADVKMVRVSKRILKSKKLDAIGQLDNEVRAYMGDRCLPSMFRGGIWLLPLDLLEEVCTYLDDKIVKRAELVDEFMAEYEDVCETAQTSLGTLYNALDYPAKAKVAATFYCEYNLVSFDVPGSLRRIKKDLFAREQAKMAEKLQAAAEDIQAGLRAAFAELVTGMSTALEPGEDGKKKRFHSSKLDNLSQFLELFQKRNITDDADLAALVTTARDLIDGVDAELIRDSEELKQQLSEEFIKLSKAVAPLATSGRRMLNLDDDD